MDGGRAGQRKGKRDHNMSLLPAFQSLDLSELPKKLQDWGGEGGKGKL